MNNVVITYDFKEKKDLIQQVNAILGNNDGEQAIDYLISIWDYHKKNTVRLYSALLQSVLGRKYSKVMKCLMLNNAIKMVSKPIDGVMAAGYQLNILKKEKGKKENKYISILLDETKSYRQKGLNESRQALVVKYKEWAKSITIEVSDEEYNSLDQNQKRYLDDIRNGNLWTKFDNFGGRLNTSLTLIDKKLRKRIKMDGEETAEVDVKTSHCQHLYHLGYIFNADEIFKTNVQKGDVYNFIAYKLKIDRNKAKNQFALTLNCKPGGYRNKAIVSLFPQLFKEVERLKFTFNDHKIISRILHKVEANDLFGIAADLMNMGVKHFTVHDCIICKKSDEKLVRKLFLEKNLKTKVD